ncbi:MAG TPA: sigma-70 family RNA polymerase sigma factor [Fimbriimonadaceae bacterium]|nr:sigma-70 family RNA polymerase sigma factor [Fimbriimonadaceae bacterium]
MAREQKKETDFLFEATVIGQLDLAFSLARWLTGKDADAEDAVQEASIKAHKAMSSYRGTSRRAWFLAIVRNACMDLLKRRGYEERRTVEADPELAADSDSSPEAIVIRAFESEELWAAIDRLPLPYREMIVLRELEELSYSEIATAVGVPIGTVMSRLARARHRLQAELVGRSVEVER